MQVRQSPVASRPSPDVRLGTGAWEKTFGPFEKKPVIAVAVSGGADSMACVLLAQEWVRAKGGHVIALTVDHGLRPESRGEAEQVSQWMHARGIEHHILRPEHVAAGNNLQQAARQWRYDALAQWCRAHGVLHCFVAHHQGDNIETALLHRARGDTEDGGSGMARVRNYYGVRFLRPLLDLKKEALQNYLHVHEVDWIEDPSNMREEFARVRVRKQLHQNAPWRVDTLNDIARERMSRAARDAALADAAVRCVCIDAAGFAAIVRGAWLALEEVLGNQLLADVVRCISGNIHRARRQEILRLAAALRSESKGKRSLQCCEIRWQDGEMCISREPARVAAPVRLRGKGKTYWDARFMVHFCIPKNREVMLAALGIHGKKQLREAGLTMDLPPATPALWYLDDVVMLPHIAWVANAMPKELACTLGFAPAKPLAATAFW